MLERAVGCLEIGGQGALHQYGAVLRSQKALDPAFWKYQFSDADLRLWLSRLHHESDTRRSAPISTQTPPGFFLDFLYPRKCLVSAAAWALKMRKGHSNIQKRRSVYNFVRNYTQVPRSRSQSAAHGRPQSSIPQTSRHAHTSANPHHLPDFEITTPNVISQDRLYRDYDRAWVLWTQGDQDPMERSRLMAYFSMSDRSLDVERAISLLEGIPLDKRSANDYEIMIQPLLEVGHLSAIERLCDDARSRNLVIDAWSLAIKIAIQISKWPHLSYIWNKKHEEISDILPSILASVSDLPGRLDSFLEYLEENSAPPSVTQLASDVLDYVFQSDKLMRDMIAETALSLTRRSANLGFLQQSHYDLAIQTLLRVGTRPSKVFAMVLYRNFRWHLSTCRPTKKLLKQLLGMLAEMKTHYGVQFLLDEFAHFFKQPSIGAYNFALIAFSRSGDISKTQETFDKMVELYGTDSKNPNVGHKTPMTPRWVTPLLLAHARMADYQSAEHEFNRIARVYKVDQNRYCWNALILAHANARNLSGAFRVWERMQRGGFTPDWYTYGTLMGLCARMGDVENTVALCKMAEKRQGPMPSALIDTVVEVYCRNQRLQEAEDIAERCLALSLSGSRTRMWNVLLWSHAFRADLDSVSRIQTRMKEAGIEFDQMTYAAIMLCFVVIGQPHSARRLLRGLQRGRKIQATEFHYTLVLYGYVQQNNRDMIYVIYKEMEQRFKNPGISARALMLRATVRRDTVVRSSETDGLADGEYRLALSEDLLFKALFDFDRRQFGSKYPRPGTSSLPLNEAFPSVLYEPVLQAYSAEGLHKRAQQLLEHYSQDVESALASKKHAVTPSLRFLSVLMGLYSQSGDFEAVKKCWDLALEKAGEMFGKYSIPVVGQVLPAVMKGDPPLPRSNVALPGVSSQPVSDEESQSATYNGDEFSDELQGEPKKNKSIMPSQQFSLSRHFSIYMTMIGKAGQSSRLREIVDDYQKRGFSMSSENWLTYVKTLATANTASDQLEAFSTFERIFMPHFPGWRLLARGVQLRPPNAPITVDLLDRYPRHKYPDLIAKKGSRLWGKLNPTWMRPTYSVIIYLAATLRDFNERSLTEGREQLDTLSAVAPLTLEAIGMMPHLREKYQGVLLRNQVEQGDLKPQQRRRYVWTGGVLGVRGKRRKHQPLPEFLDDSDGEVEEYQNPEESEQPEEHMETLEPTLAPQDEHDLETEVFIESTRRELGIDPVREEELLDLGSK